MRTLAYLLALSTAFAGVPALADEPAQRPCVDGRQTEDPLSPDCVAYWFGDNGGATSSGVTAHAVRIAIYHDDTIGSAASAAQRLGVFFNRRYEFYGRKVSFVDVQRSGTTPERYRADAARLSEYSVFAVVPIGIDAPELIDEAARRGILSFGVRSRSTAAWSLYPDAETSTAVSASFLCRTLGSDRRLGILLNERTIDAAVALRDALSATCGRASEGRPYLPDLPTTIAAFQAFAVRTVVCLCEGDLAAIQAVATLQGYFPDWYLDDATGLAQPDALRTGALPVQRVFGTTSFWRHTAPAEQYAYRAAVEADPSKAPDPVATWPAYHALQLAATAIQRAGPNLTSGTVETGLRGHVRRDLADPYLPSGGYEDGPTFVDSATAWWWDPSGSAPGSTVPGCMRLARDGLRSYAGGWPSGDDDLFTPAAPCTGESRWAGV